MKGTIYNKTTGAISSIVQGPDEASIQLQCMFDENLAAYIGEELDAGKWYFVNGQPVERQSLGMTFDPPREDSPNGYEDAQITLAPGQVLTITGIPVGMELMYPGGRVVVNDGFIEWSCDTPGTYYFRMFTDIKYEGVAFDAVVR